MATLAYFWRKSRPDQPGLGSRHRLPAKSRPESLAPAAATAYTPIHPPRSRLCIGVIRHGLRRTPRGRRPRHQVSAIGHDVLAVLHLGGVVSTRLRLSARPEVQRMASAADS